MLLRGTGQGNRYLARIRYLRRRTTSRRGPRHPPRASGQRSRVSPLVGRLTHRAARFGLNRRPGSPAVKLLQPRRSPHPHRGSPRASSGARQGVEAKALSLPPRSSSTAQIQPSSLQAALGVLVARGLGANLILPIVIPLWVANGCCGRGAICSRSSAARPAADGNRPASPVREHLIARGAGLSSSARPRALQN